MYNHSRQCNSPGIKCFLTLLRKLDARSRLLYLRRIETGNNEVLKRILEDSKKHKKSKWWETTRKYMNWAQIEEREIKEKTAKEIRGKIAKVV